MFTNQDHSAPGKSTDVGAGLLERLWLGQSQALAVFVALVALAAGSPLDPRWRAT